jgi:dTDP-4-amino-4,6-dideoxygalactose transaminase
MSEFGAAVGLVHLKRLNDFIAARERIAELYTQELQRLPGLTPVLPAARSSWYKYIVLLPAGSNREQIKAAVKERGVSLPGGVYDVPLHQQPAFRALAGGPFPVADDICARHICLPLYFGMSEDDARYVVEALGEALGRA